MENSYNNKMMGIKNKENKADANFLIPFKQVKEIFGISSAMLYKRVQSGAWPVIRIGRRGMYFNKEFIESKKLELGIKE